MEDDSNISTRNFANASRQSLAESAFPQAHGADHREQLDGSYPFSDEQAVGLFCQILHHSILANEDMGYLYLLQKVTMGVFR